MVRLQGFKIKWRFYGERNLGLLLRGIPGSGFALRLRNPGRIEFFGPDRIPQT